MCDTKCGGSASGDVERFCKDTKKKEYLKETDLVLSELVFFFFFFLQMFHYTLTGQPLFYFLYLFIY